MLLRRILAWGGQQNLFPPEQFGFLPSRDCTLALGTLLNDISTARSQKHFIFAICLDIKAAYDSVCPDILSYKIAQFGMGGKTGRWILEFTHFRYLRIYWKFFQTGLANWFHGVPQGSVLSPLLFLFYMLDINETLEVGTHLIIYADDIVVYATDPDEDRARTKLQNTIDRISLWCRANELSIAPDKCGAINFSRRRDPGNPLKIHGIDIQWQSPIRILGVWFTRSLCFTPHFQKKKFKTFQTINYLKTIASRSRGITSHHMLRIVNSLIRSSLEFGAPLFFNSPPTALKILEVSYNAAIRLATGLPRWTPLPVLLREAGVSSITHRINLLTRLFIIRLLSLPSGIRLGDIPKGMLTLPNPNWKWWVPLQHISLLSGSPLSYLISLRWPPPQNSIHFTVTDRDLPFQDLSLPPELLLQFWYSWFHSLPPCMVLATDASKDDCKTSIAALEVNSGCMFAGLVPHSNSVFTAEALAIYMALCSFQAHHPSIILLSDSLSVLSALKTWSNKSPTIILLLINIIQTLNSQGHTINLIWCPGHRGIPPNETVDTLAKKGPFTQTILKIAPEDVRTLVKKDWMEEINYTWINCDYANLYPHLLPSRSYAKWTPTRAEDVTIARWRSRTLLTCHRLYRMQYTYSPLCNFCYEIETPDHILLQCPRLTNARSALLQALQLPTSSTYSDILIAATSTKSSLLYFLTFSRTALPQDP